MINVRRRKKSRVLIVISVTIILIFFMYIFYKNEYLFKLSLYFSDLGYKLEDSLIINKYNFNSNISLGINKNLEEENNELRELLNIDNNAYDMITSTIIERNDWYNSIIINKGKKDGIKKNMAVINGYGLIGKIIKVANNYSEVLLITSNLNSKIAVDINSYHGILDGYDNGLLIIKNIDKNSTINIGDKVYTNGLGGIYPRGIYIGKVESVEDDKLELAKIVKISIHSNIDNIRYVNVIRR